MGHIAKCFGLRDPPSQITGIGKGNWVKKEAQKKVNLFPIVFFYRLNFLRFFTRFCFLLFFVKKSCIANFFVKSQCSLLDFLHLTNFSIIKFISIGLLFILQVDLKREHKVIKAQETRINQKSLVMSEYSSGFEGANLDLGIKGVLGPKKESKKSITKKKLKRLK